MQTQNAEKRRHGSWNEFFRSPGIKFCPVKRMGGLSDPNDEAIQSEARRLVKLPQTQGIALLTNDRDFAPLVTLLRSSGKAVFVLIRKVRSGNKVIFEDAGATVFLVGDEPAVSKVRAILNSDGTGSVALAEDPPDPDSEALVGMVADRMLHLDYLSDNTCTLLPALAKFWFQHDLGSLVVRPLPSALKSVHQIFLENQERAAWERYRHNLAFILPLAGGSRTTKKISEADRFRYGSSTAKRIYHGGGPFVLPQSDCLAINVLKKLRYLDESMNSDLNEGLLVFLNDTCNKRNMRKSDAMPGMGDSRDKILATINQALVSGRASGQWSLAPGDMDVRKKLVADNFLRNEEEKPEVVFRAMQDYSKQFALPSRRSYNAYAWQIKHFVMDPNSPDRRDWLQPTCLLK